MNILTRYLAATFLRYLVSTLFVLISLVLLANLFASIEEVLSGWRELLAFLERMARSIPGVVEMLLPMAVLIAAMFTFIGFARNSELIAMKTAGSGPWRLTAPLLVVLVPVAVAGYYNQNYLYAQLNPPGRENQQAAQARHQWRSVADGVVYFDRVDRRRRIVFGVRGFRWGGTPFRIQEIQQIRRGRPTAEGWRLSGITVRRQSGGQWTLERESAREVSDTEVPGVFEPADFDPRHVPFWELYQEFRRREMNGERVAVYKLEWYQKPAALFALVVMALLGVALVQSSPRRGRLGLETSITLLMGVMFWLAMQIFFMLGKGEFVPPIAAAWMPNLIFLGIGYVLYRRSF